MAAQGNFRFTVVRQGNRMKDAGHIANVGNWFQQKHVKVAALICEKNMKVASVPTQQGLVSLSLFWRMNILKQRGGSNHVCAG